jgi:hypothetical protein
MKKIFALFLFCTLAIFTHAQAVLPNISYNGYLNSTCATPNTGCAGAVFVTSYGSQSNSGPLGSGSTIDVPVANYSAATVTVSGTYAGSTINFDFSDPTSGTNYFQEVCARTDINLLEVSEVLPTNQVRAWQCPVWAATRFRVRQSAYTSGNVNVWITLTQAAIDPSLVVAASITNIAGASDPCADVSAIKLSAPINISSATTAQLVALSGTTTIYVCSFVAAANAGTNPSIQFEYGTGSNCATSPVVLTGAMATGVTVATGVAGPIFAGGGSATIFKSAAGNELCAVTAGTTPNFQGYVTYVQQ